jgi:hypothetical protein
MSCEICNTLNNIEEWNNLWLDETPSGPVAFQKLLYVGHKNDSHVYKCPDCGQVYLSITWNELFPDGWTAFNRLKKLNKEEVNKYLE